jgi:hypothetical protein
MLNADFIETLRVGSEAAFPDRRLFRDGMLKALPSPHIHAA